MNRQAARQAAVALLLLLASCSPSDQAETPQTQVDARWQLLWEQAGDVDTVGVARFQGADTTSSYPGLTAIESTVRFPERAAGGEVFAWEFHAVALEPVKLIIVRYDRQTELFELTGESETRIPDHPGLNRFVLREPIPVARGDQYGIHMPGAEALPFKVITNWRTLISTKGLQRPFMPRDDFAMYGWQYPVRVFWRSPKGE